VQRKAVPSQVYILSAHGADVLRKDVLAQGARGLVDKPLMPSVVLDLIARVQGSKPLDAEPVQAPAARHKTSVRLDGLQVLLVEDNALNQQIARELLQRRGARVDVVHHGQQALHKLQELGPEAYHVVLMDLQMPVMDGHEATAAIRQDPHFLSLPIIAMTAHVMPEERERCLAEGMVDHIGKPLDPSRLAAVLARYLPPGAAPQRAPEPLPDASPPRSAFAFQLPEQPSSPPRFDPHPLLGASAAQPPAPQAPPLYLPRIQGIDARAAMVGFDDDLSLYQSTLKGFVRHSQAVLGWLPDGLHNGDWRRLNREGHTLKGLGGTIGCQALSHAAARLEEAAQQEVPGPIEEAVRALTQCLAPLTLAIQAYLEGRHSVDDSTPAKRLGNHPSLGTSWPGPAANPSIDTISDA
jgi:CheY-like chemotaxis protein/HPt (histidine-containing phosphotransfer) domain-containing protein